MGKIIQFNSNGYSVDIDSVKKLSGEHKFRLKTWVGHSYENDYRNSKSVGTSANGEQRSRGLCLRV